MASFFGTASPKIKICIFRLYKLLRIIAQNSEELFDKKRGKKTAKDQGLTDQLYEQVGRLQMELSWLKKKSVLEY